MATEKILNTRIKLRYDSFENWQKSTGSLLDGEVALCYVQAVPTKEVNSVSAPQVLMKVGPGVFKDLPWLSGLAADVHAWAKKSTVSYDGVNNKIVFSNGSTDANPISFDFDVVTPTELSAILADYYTKTETNNKIAEEIGKLDVTVTGMDKGKTLASLTETDGKIAATFQDIEITKSQISDFDEDDYATSAQGEAADAAAAKLAGIDTTVVDYVTDAIEGVTGGDITVDTAKNYDTTTGNIKTKFEEIEEAIEAAKKYADDNDTNTAHTHSAGDGLKLTGNGGIDGDTKYELNLGLTLKDGDIVLHDKDNATKVIATLDAAELLEDSYLNDVEINGNNLEFTWKMDDGTTKTDSVDLTHLVDVYTGKDGTTIKVTVDKYEISAEVKEGSIGVTQLDGNVNGQLQYTTQLCDSIGQNQTIEKANSAVQSVSIGTGSSNGTISLNVDGTNTEASVKGLGTAAYTASTDYITGIASGSGLELITDNSTKVKSVGIMVEGVGTRQIASNAVTTEKIADNAVTTAKIADKAVTTAKIADHAVGAAQTKAEQGYNGADAEVWVFDCGGAQ